MKSYQFRYRLFGIFNVQYQPKVVTWLMKKYGPSVWSFWRGHCKKVQVLMYFIPKVGYVRAT